MCRLLGRVVCRLPERSTCRLLTLSASRFLDRSGLFSLRQRVLPSSDPLRGCFFLLVSWPGLSRWPPPYTGFSLLHSFPVSPSCGSLVLGPFTRLALQAWGHWYRVYFHHPLGPFGYWKQGMLSPQTDGSAVCRYAY